jgi:hypothetical protein
VEKCQYTVEKIWNKIKGSGAYTMVGLIEQELLYIYHVYLHFRYSRFDKAFLLAVDIGSRDLFMVSTVAR